MGRIKLYDRDALLNAAMLVFWQRGYADTSLQQLERATGVNKSGLYAEFHDKEDLFLSSLRHYVARRGAEGLLAAEPPGWANVETLLRRGPLCDARQKGCFAISAMREFASLPPAAREIVAASQNHLLRQLTANIAVETTRLPARQVAELVMVFFTGLCADMHADPAPRTVSRKIKNFIAMLRTV